MFYDIVYLVEYELFIAKYRKWFRLRNNLGIFPSSREVFKMLFIKILALKPKHIQK